MSSLADLPAVDVTGVEVRHLALPTGLPSFVLPSGHRTPTDLAALLVRVTDADGAAGQSLLWAQAPGQLTLIEACMRHTADALAGIPPASPEQLASAVSAADGFFGPTGVLRFGLSGLEMAVVDLSLRRAGVSLSSWLGRRHDHVLAYETGLMLFRSIDELIDEAVRLHESGRTAMKMIVGSPSICADVERLAAVREALPSSARLMVDALQRWDLGSALDAVDAFAGLGLDWVEDPIAHSDIAGYRALAGRAAMPIATGESHYDLERFGALAEAGVRFVVAELERVGGISGWLQVAELLTGTSASVLPHLYPHVSTQLVSTLDQDEVWVEHVPWFDDLVGGPSEIRDGRLVVADAPGTGFDPDPDAVERLATSPWRRLGGGRSGP